MSPQVDFDELQPKSPWEVIVDRGWYRCRIENVVEMPDGNWRVPLNHVGEPAFEVTDYLRFNGKALPRVQILYEALGLSCKGQVDCQPSDIEGKQVLAYVEPEEREGKMRMKVTFDGYRSTRDEVVVRTENSSASPAAGTKYPPLPPDGAEIPF